MIFLWTVILLFWNSTTATDVCPDDADISPCYCITDSIGYSYVSCSRMRVMHRLAQILDKVKGRNVSLGFEKSLLGDIPSDFFAGQIGQDISFDHCKIESFGSKPFSGMENTLQKINVFGSVDKRDKDLETFPLGHLKKLRELTFSGNEITRLGNDWFQDGPESLVYLGLEANGIKDLGDKAFQSLVNVEQIWLGDNDFKVFKRSMLPKPALKLNLLEISFNAIATFPEDSFTDMPSLKVINVAGNRLTTLPETTWGRIWNQLDEVYLERNYNLECDMGMSWIYKRQLPTIFSGKCYGTNSLSNRNLQDLTSSDFH